VIRPGQAPLDLTRTRAALAAWRAAGDAFDRSWTQARADALDAAREALGVAFARDTADRNDFEVVRDFVGCLAGLDFVRRLCADPRLEVQP
jgi:hypothetical protein